MKPAKSVKFSNSHCCVAAGNVSFDILFEIIVFEIIVFDIEGVANYQPFTDATACTSSVGPERKAKVQRVWSPHIFFLPPVGS